MTPAVPSLLSCPPALPASPGALPGRAFASGVGVWSAGVAGLSQYWAGVARRRTTPFGVLADQARWWRAMTDRRPPTWATPHEIVFATPVARLRNFSRPGARGVPTVILPPQAGHDSCIVDFSPEQSQVKVALAAGLSRLYSLDWVGATRQTRDLGVEDYVGAIDETLDLIGSPANLIGDCQGGWLAALYAALRPDRVHSLTIAGAPIDFHAGSPQIGEWVSALSPGRHLSFYRWLVEAHGGVLKGEYMLGGFVALAPESEVGKQLQLLARLDEPRHLDRYQAFENWYKHTQDVPGRFYLWIVENLFRDNALISGRLRVAGERVDLSRITCPLTLLAGAADHITPPAQVFAAADHVATAAADIVVSTTNGGHLGLFMGNDALRNHWPGLLARVAELSDASHRTAAARAARRATPPRTPALPAP